MKTEILFHERKRGWRREVFDERRALFRASVDPPREELEFGIGELGFAHGRHVLLVVEREVRTIDHQARGGVARLERRAVFSAGEEELQGIHAEVAVALRGVVALHALGFDDWLDGRDINGGVLLGAFVHRNWLGFSTECDREVGGEVILAVGERTAVVPGCGDQAERGEQEK